MTLGILIALASLTCLLVVIRARRRAAERAAEARRARARATRRNRIPAVSNNVKGVTATQATEHVYPPRPDDTDVERAA